MAYRNRVSPFGDLHANPVRGAWMGNRGVLHDENKQIVLPWMGKRWITCVLNFAGRRREVLSPHRYTELFFLDEATAFAAGHRPCAECRRSRFREFRDHWIAANTGIGARSGMGVDAIDRILHSERAIRGGGKKTFDGRVGDLAPGTFIGSGSEAFLVWDGVLWKWSFEGYRDPQPIGDGARLVQVLTPPSIVRTFAAGFRPQVHDSAGATPIAGP